MSKLPTPHIDAKPGDFAKTVLMPGDPLRAKFIAETFLDDPVLVNNVRGVQGHTGTYKGVRVSVMASGMGMPSIGIYSHELFNFFGVDNIIRVGTSCAISPEVNLREIVMGAGASTDSNYARKFHLPGTFAPIAGYGLLRACTETADEMGVTYHVGNILSSDIFYEDDECMPENMHTMERWRTMGVLACDMEAAALYMNAARSGKSGLAICTVADHTVTGEAVSPMERQTAFTQMIELALNTAVKLENI